MVKAKNTAPKSQGAKALPAAPKSGKAKMVKMPMPNAQKATVKKPIAPRGSASRNTASGVQGGLSALSKPKTTFV
jgi:hypothetical protein